MCTNYHLAPCIKSSINTFVHDRTNIQTVSANMCLDDYTQIHTATNITYTSSHTNKRKHKHTRSHTCTHSITHTTHSHLLTHSEHTYTHTSHTSYMHTYA